MQEILTVIVSIVTSGLLSGGLIWLTKSWITERLKNAIKHEYDEKLETHKAQLKSQSEVEIERLKSQLQIAASENNVRFSKVFERTAETIATTHEKLLALQDAVVSYTSPIEFEGTPSKEERRKIVSETLVEFNRYYRPRSLFLPKETATKLDEFAWTLRNQSVDFRLSVERSDALYAPGHPPDWKKWIEITNFMNKEAPKLLNALQDDFRNLLGTAPKLVGTGGAPVLLTTS